MTFWLSFQNESTYTKCIYDYFSRCFSCGLDFKKTPPRYIDPYQKQRYSLPHLVAAFQEQDSVRFEVAYAVPKRRIKAFDDGRINIVDGIFLFDRNCGGSRRHTYITTR